jgi:hypothetical protein
MKDSRQKANKRIQAELVGLSVNAQLRVFGREADDAHRQVVRARPFDLLLNIGFDSR